MRNLDKLILTEMPVLGKPCTASAWIEDGRAAEISFSPLEQNGILGNIYVGQVENVLPNIQGAFIRIGEGQVCFYSLKEQEQAIYTNGKRPVNGRYVMKAGDQLLVQVVREGMRGKRPMVTSKLEFTGKYLVLTVANPSLGLSSKLSKEDRIRLRAWLEPEIWDGCGFIVRTNAGQATKDEIFRELKVLRASLQDVMERGRSRTVCSLVEEAQPYYLTAVQDAYTEKLQEVVTDVPEVYGKVETYLEVYHPEDLPRLHLYRDPLLPLYKRYSLERVLSQAQQKRVWLKSGGFLVIEQTEAFVSIDVNTGKYVSNKKAQETYRKINLEAAQEIAFQLRLRNLSGIILVDFINLEGHEYEQELMDEFQKYLWKDPVKTRVMDITALKIVEVTRQKVRKPLSEKFKDLGKSDEIAEVTQ